MDYIDYILIGVLLVFIATVALLFLKIKKYNVEVVIRRLTSKGRVIQKDKGALLYTDDKYKVFKLLKSKDKLNVPHQDVLDLKSNGKYFLEAYADEEGNYWWIKDRGKFSSFAPVSTNRNNILAGQFRKAEQKSKTWKDNVGLYASLGALILIIAIVVFGIGEPINAIKDFQQSTTDDLIRSQELSIELVDAINELKNDVQRIESRIPSNETRANGTGEPPN